jgi:outer membrane protein assembly factor BamB
MKSFAPGQIVVAGCMAILAVTFCGADWRQFRGNDSNAISSETSLPTSLSGETIAWKVDLPGRGVSGPIVIGDRLFLTSSSGYSQDRLHTLCFDTKTGKQLWERQFWATGRTMCHNKMSVATPTPASDGERIFSFYSSNDLTCVDLDGNLLWYRGLGSDYPNASNSLGMSSSPVVVGDTVIVQVESDAEAFAAGLDVKTGAQKWKIDRPRKANWTSPAVLRGADGQDLVLLQSSAGLSAVDPQTGDEVWSFDKGASTIPSSTPVGNTIYVPSNGLTVLKASATGVEVDWNVSRLRPSTPSALVYDNRVFTVDRAGVLKCADQETGELKWQLRLKGPFSATPVAGAGMLFFFNEDGMAYIVKPDEDDGSILSELNLGETILSTPAVADKAIFVRSDQHLWKIADNN